MTKIRPGVVGDAEILAAIANFGFESYREFGPPGYEPPTVEHEASQFRLSFETGEYWCRIAEDDQGPVGQVAFRPREVEPGLVHFQRLFLLPRAWGTGLAARLMDLAVDEMRRRGYGQARLFTPEGHARARRFYERSGWHLHGEPAPEPRLGNLSLVEYRLDLPSAP